MSKRPPPPKKGDKRLFVIITLDDGTIRFLGTFPGRRGGAWSGNPRGWGWYDLHNRGGAQPAMYTTVNRAAKAARRVYGFSGKETLSIAVCVSNPWQPFGFHVERFVYFDRQEGTRMRDTDKGLAILCGEEDHDPE